MPPRPPAVEGGGGLAAGVKFKGGPEETHCGLGVGVAARCLGQVGEEQRHTGGGARDASVIVAARSSSPIVIARPSLVSISATEQRRPVAVGHGRILLYSGGQAGTLIVAPWFGGRSGDDATRGITLAGR
jgi:hypothetical protein